MTENQFNEIFGQAARRAQVCLDDSFIINSLLRCIGPKGME